MITADLVVACVGASQARAALWAPALSAAMDLFAITTPMRIAAFLPQVGHESGRLVYTREIWGPNAAQLRYEGRKDLGNVRPGDGRRFLGRGPIQITGRFNYIATRDNLRKLLPNVPDFEASPELLENPSWGSYAAGLFWHANGLSAPADAGDFDGVCDLVNLGRKTARVGDSNGYADRLSLYISAKKALGIST